MVRIDRTDRLSYLGHALEEEIRGRIADRRWYRSHRHWPRFADLERENVIALRGLFRARREGLRTWRDEDARLHHIEADFFSVNLELDELREADLASDGLPDVPVAVGWV